MAKPCSTQDCSRTVYAKGMCDPCYQRARYAANPDRKRSASRAWYEANRGASVEYSRAYREAHQSACYERVAAWRKDNPDKVAALAHKRRTARTEAGGSYSAAEWRALLDGVGHACVACGATDRKLTADHIMPVSMGGTSWIANIQPLCGPCNSRKGARFIAYGRPSPRMQNS